MHTDTLIIWPKTIQHSFSESIYSKTVHSAQKETGQLLKLKGFFTLKCWNSLPAL